MKNWIPLMFITVSTALNQKVRNNFVMFMRRKIGFWLHIFCVFVNEIRTQNKHENVSRWSRNKDPWLAMIVEKAFIVIYRENWVWTVSFSYYTKLKYFYKFQFQFFLEVGKTDMNRYAAIKIDFPFFYALNYCACKYQYIYSENDYIFLCFFFVSYIAK